MSPSPHHRKKRVSGRENHEMRGLASGHCLAASISPVYSHALPVCKDRSARYPLGIPTSAINQTMSVAVKVSYVRRTQLKNINYNAEFSLQHTADYSNKSLRTC